MIARRPIGSRPIVGINEADFRSFVKITDDGCHEWCGYIFNGYGMYRKFFAHRVAYTIYVGPIPPKLTIDHLCRNKTCVNPAHLEPVPQRTNTNRGFAVLVPLRTHCKRGHLWTPENTIRWQTYRYCRTCARNGNRAYQKRKRAKKRQAAQVTV